MDILTKFLTVVLFLNCLFLILLVLVQLPKKEAGLGTAFGGGTTDALFGAGAGNVLTKLIIGGFQMLAIQCVVCVLAWWHQNAVCRQGPDVSKSMWSQRSAPPRLDHVCSRCTSPGLAASMC